MALTRRDDSSLPSTFRCHLDASAISRTLPDGTADSTGDSGHCESWSVDTLIASGNKGLADRVDEFWTTFNNSSSCNSDWRLYCFQQQ